MINEEQQPNKNEVPEGIEKTVNHIVKKIEENNEKQIAYEKSMKDMKDYRRKNK